MSTPIGFVKFPKSILQADTAGFTPASVDSVHDGDTFFCWVWNPVWNTYQFVAIRIKDLRCAELWEPGGPEERENAKKILKRDTPLGLRKTGMSFNRVVCEVIDRDLALVGRTIEGLREVSLAKDKVIKNEEEEDRIKEDDKYILPPRRPHRKTYGPK